MNEFLKPALMGDSQAQYNLAVTYAKAGDFKNAIKWYEKAGEKGFRSAQFNLSTHLLFGDGVEKNDPLGMKWLTRAAILKTNHIRGYYCV